MAPFRSPAIHAPVAPAAPAARPRRSPRRRAGRAAAALALLAAAAGLPARAALVLDTLEITAATRIDGLNPAGPVHDVQRWQLGQGQPVVVGSQQGDARAGMLAAQSPDGFSHNRVQLATAWNHAAFNWQLEASTEFIATLHATTPDTPVVLGFHFFGSEVALGAHYGAGSWNLEAQELIAGGRVGAGQPGVQRLWSVGDQLQLSGGVARTAPGGTDAQSIGLPTLSVTDRWVEFERQLALRRDVFSGTLDFGLLQPGETFRLQYTAFARMQVSSSFYPGHALAFVVDPFSFAQPAAQLTLDGLELPTPVGSVPEPGTWLLWLGGLLVLARQAGRRGGGSAQRRRAAAAAVLLPAALALGGAGPARAQFAPAAANAEVQAFRFDGHDWSATDHFQPRRAAVSLGGAGTLGNGAGEGSFLGTAVASLARGSLHASSALQTTGDSFAQVSASASLYDLLFFDNTQPVTVSAELVLHGAFQGLDTFGNSAGADLQFGGESARVALYWDGFLGGPTDRRVRMHVGPFDVSGGGRVELRSDLPSGTLAVLRLQATVLPGVPVSLRAAMGVSSQTSGSASAQADFGNTAQLALWVPEGVGFRSQSGVLLSQAPVPEPASAGLLALGLAGLALRRRGRAGGDQALRARRACTSVQVISQGLPSGSRK